MRYAVVIEMAKRNYSAYVPDLQQEIRTAIRFHIEGLREDGLPIPAATSSVEYVEA